MNLGKFRKIVDFISQILNEDTALPLYDETECVM